MKTGKIIKCCPLCGGRIVVSVLQQYSFDYVMLKDGTISKRYKRGVSGSMDACIAACENVCSCGAQWEVDEFEIDSNRRFFDYKYSNNKEIIK